MVVSVNVELHILLFVHFLAATVFDSAPESRITVPTIDRSMNNTTVNLVIEKPKAM